MGCCVSAETDGKKGASDKVSMEKTERKVQNNFYKVHVKLKGTEEDTVTTDGSKQQIRTEIEKQRVEREINRSKQMYWRW